MAFRRNSLREEYERNRCSKFSAINDHQPVLPDTKLKKPDKNEATTQVLMMFSTFCAYNLIRFYTCNFSETPVITELESLVSLSS